MGIKNITQELKGLHSEIERLELIESQIINKFYDIYPCLKNHNETVWVVYYGIEYVVTNIDFTIQSILLETSPYQDGNEVVWVGFELFEEIFNEYHEVVKI